MTALPAQQEKILQLVKTALDDHRSPKDCEILHRRSGDRGMLLRVTDMDGESVIVKAWALSSCVSRLRHAVFRGNGQREWSMHNAVADLGINVARPWFYTVIQTAKRTNYEVMAIQDLGKTTRALQYMKACRAAGHKSEIDNCGDQVITALSQMISGHLMDIDHQLNNFLVDQSGSIYRVDFECCRRIRSLRWQRSQYATVLDRLIRSHVYALHPEADYTGQFIRQLIRHLTPPSDVLNLARKRIEARLTRDRLRTGAEFALPQDCWTP